MDKFTAPASDFCKQNAAQTSAAESQGIHKLWVDMAVWKISCTVTAILRSQSCRYVQINHVLVYSHVLLSCSGLQHLQHIIPSTCKAPLN